MYSTAGNKARHCLDRRGKENIKTLAHAAFKWLAKIYIYIIKSENMMKDDLQDSRRSKKKKRRLGSHA